MSSEQRDSKEARKRTKGLVGAAGIFAAVAVIVLAAVLLAPMIQSETGDQSQNIDTESVTVTYSIGNFGRINETYNNKSGSESSMVIRYRGVPIAEYNPQFWAGSIVGEVLKIDGVNSDNELVQDWLQIKRYPSGNVSRLIVFSGWEVFDPDPDVNETVTVDPGTDLTKYIQSGNISLTAKWSTANWIWNMDRGNPSNRSTVEFAKYRNIILLNGNVDDLGTLRYNYDSTIRSPGTKYVIDANNKQAGSNLIIDNVSLRGASSRDGYGGLGDHGNDNGLYGSGSLIIGTGVENVNGTYVQVLGGWKSNNSGTAKLTVFSGTYEIIAGGSYDKNVGKTELTLAGSYNGSNLKVNGTVYGGNTHSGTIGSTKVLIAGGMVSDGEMYTIPSNGKYQTVIGGSRNSGHIDSTEVILTGTASVFMVQGGGRATSVAVDETNVTISGAASVFYMACGSVTDANTGSTPPVMTSNITLKDSATIGQPNTTNGLLLGGGWDTYGNPLGSSTGTTNVFVEGGTVFGSVYGGGFRGSVGNGNRTAVNVTISKGEIHGSVYGGGKGGPDPLGNIATWDAQYNSTGLAYALGDVSIDITGGTIHGSVYGGGEGARKTGYGGYEDVAKVVGDITVSVGGAKIDGSVYGGGKGLPTSEISWYQSSVADVARVTGVISVSVNGAEIDGSVYGGGAYGNVTGRVVDNVSKGTKVAIGGGSIAGNVFGGGLGEQKESSDTAYSVNGSREVVMTGGTVKASIFGSSSLGNDLGDSGITVSGGTVSGSLFGGGYKGYTNGSTAIHVYGDAHIAMSIYGGGDVGDTTGDDPVFTKVLVTGDSTITVEGSGVTLGRSIFGSGNSCLIGGDATIIINGLRAEPMESIQRAKVVSITASRVALTGRSDGSSAQASTRYSLNLIEDLKLIGGTYLEIQASVGSLSNAGSYIVDGVQSMSTSPTNTVRLKGGAVLEVKDGEGYQKVNGYAVLSIDANEQYHGALAYGSPQSPGGFVVAKDGTYVVADTSDITTECRCWFIAGAVKKTTTIVAKGTGSGSSTTETSTQVVLPKIFPSTSLVYIGHTAEGDRLDLVGTAPTSSAQFKLTVGDGGDITFDSSIVPTGAYSYEYELATGSGTNPVLGLKLEHLDDFDLTGHAGYVTLRFWEAVQINVGGNAGWIAQNRIDLELEIHTESSVANFERNYTVRIETKNGSGSTGFVIPRGFEKHTVEIEGYQSLGSGTLYSQPSLNSEGTRGWDMPMGDRRVVSPGTTVGTLSGSFAATLTLSVEGVESDSSGLITMKLVSPDGSVKRFTVTVETVDAGYRTVTFITRHMTDDRWTPDPPRHISVPKGDAIPASKIPETGDFFVGWYLDEQNDDNPFNPVGVYDMGSPVNGHITLYACYRWQVTFDFGNGSVVKLYLPVKTGGTDIGAPAVPQRDGYEFPPKWTRQDGAEAFTGDTETITDDTVFTAVWEGKKVVVVYEYDGAEISRVEYRYGETYGSGMDEARNSLDLPPGHVFVGWRHGEAFVDTSAEVAKQDHKLTAVVTVEPTLHVVLSITQDDPWHGGGEILGSTDFNVQATDDGVYAFTPANAIATGYQLTAWKSGSFTVPAGAVVTATLTDSVFTVIYGNQSIIVPEDGTLELHTVWEALMYDVVVEQPTGGSIVPMGDQRVPYGTPLSFEYVPQGSYTLRSWGHTGEGEWTADGNTLSHTVVSDCFVYATVYGSYGVMLKLNIDGQEEKTRKVWLQSDGASPVPMTYNASGYYFVEATFGYYDLLVERSDGGKDSVLAQKLYVYTDDSGSRTVDLHTIELSGDSTGASAPEFAQKGRSVTVTLPEDHRIEKAYYVLDGTEHGLTVSGTSFAMADHPVTVVIKRDLEEVTLTVYDPPKGKITVTRGGTELVPTPGTDFSTYKVNINDSIVLGFSPEGTGVTLYRWVVDRVGQAPDEDGKHTFTVEDNTAVFVVMLLEGEQETVVYTEKSFSKLISRSDGFTWVAGWDGASFDAFTIQLEQYGIEGMKLTIAQDSISISGLGGVTGTVHVEGVVAEIGGKLYSIDVLVRIVPYVSQGEVSQ